MPRWKPRTGRTAEFMNWNLQLTRLLGHIGMTVEELDETPPTLSEVQLANPQHDAISAPLDALQALPGYVFCRESS